MLIEAIVAAVFVVGVFLVCVAVAVTQDQRRERAEIRELEGHLHTVLERMQSERGGRR